MNKITCAFKGLNTDDVCTHHVTLATLSVGTIDRFCISKKGGIGGGGWAQSGHAMHMAAVFASCRKALVGAGWAVYFLHKRP